MPCWLLRPLGAYLLNHVAHGGYHGLRLVELDVVRGQRHDLVAAACRPRGLFVVQRAPDGIHAFALFRGQRHLLQIICGCPFTVCQHNQWAITELACLLGHGHGGFEASHFLCECA